MSSRPPARMERILRRLIILSHFPAFIPILVVGRLLGQPQMRDLLR